MRPAGLRLIGACQLAVGEPAFRIVGNKVRWAADSDAQDASRTRPPERAERSRFRASVVNTSERKPRSFDLSIGAT